ncbi:MAG: glutamine--fructose-6-phosphate aminotransferase, partial [Candidatus Thermoplasmatota archaeon]
MCGILGIAGKENASTFVLDGLRRLEYRGYDSAGIAVLGARGLEVRRAVGPVAALAALELPSGPLGIGHTRWATHGAPSERNAHPHRDCSHRLAVVHNGIIENHVALREKLVANGHVFESDTDTEVLAHLIEEHLPGDLLLAVRSALALVEGSYALAVISQDSPGRIIAARERSPLLVGLADGRTLLASDALALLPHTRRVVYLEDGDVAEVTARGVDLWSLAGTPRTVRVHELPAPPAIAATKSHHEHHMLREIHESPAAFRELLRGRVELVGDHFDVEGRLDERHIRGARRIIILACGTSYYAGVIGKSLLER